MLSGVFRTSELGSTKLLIPGAVETLTHALPVNTFVLALVFCVAVIKMLTCEDIIVASPGGITRYSRVSRAEDLA